ncbi:hypothetical protein PENCOP_c001G02667 [Penicillium coprophilum]|uniref:Uncharacterized protein n=1 Tax=Penicillium coprophilum TaxID=36646 RepID=A0A1V6V784_9EURO|nr:hypothetical protein PENCOP_c001G02667 [Penicillium coprophilum]
MVRMVNPHVQETVGRIVGALVMSITSSGIQSHTETNGMTPPTNKDYDAFIRAWTVQKSFRGYGVGAALLNEAVLICYHHQWKGPRFANSHTNSLRDFPSLFNSEMDQESAMWSSYLRKRIEANRQSRSAFEARMLHAPLNHLNANYGQSPRVDIPMRLIRIQVKLEELIRRYFDMRLDKAFEAQARWKESS